MVSHHHFFSLLPYTGTMSSIEQEGDGVYQLQSNDADVNAQQQQQSRRLMKVAIAAGILFAVSALVLVVQAYRTSHSPDTTIYTVDYSEHGIPDACQDYTTFCAQDTVAETLECTCGSYLYQWTNDEWVQE